MPAWPGGPCPVCGEHMPENLIHCQRCRAMLNPDLDSDSVEIPKFIPLQEIEAMVEAGPVGYFVHCPHCEQELKISGKYVGQKVKCKLCDQPFKLNLKSSDIRSDFFYTPCPHCDEELRVSAKYLGVKVACKNCNGKIHFVG